MKDKKFKSVSFDNKKKRIIFTYFSGKRVSVHYGALGIKKNIKDAFIDKETKNQSIKFDFEDGTSDYMPYDQPLAATKDPGFILKTHIETVIACIKAELKNSKISKKYLAEKLKTSDNQIQRLLNPAILNKNLEQLYKIASLLGLEFEIKLNKAA